MATDLFKKYYNNPAKQYIYADINCPGASSASDTTFDIQDGAAVITDSNGNTASVDLSGLDLGVNTFDNQTVQLQPNSVIALKGTSHGEQQMTRGFGYFADNVIEDEQWKYFVKVKFELKYRNYGRICVYHVCVSADSCRLLDIEKAIQEYFNTYEIPISVFLVDNYLMFIGNEKGFEYFIDDMKYDVILSSDDPASCFDKMMWENVPKKSVEWYDCLYELEDVYVPAMKYKNGAFRGIIIRANYPKYNDASISDSMRSIKIAYVKDRINRYSELISGTDRIYYGNTVDVDVDYKTTSEYNALKWLFPSKFDCKHCRYDNEIDDWRPADEMSQESDPRAVRSNMHCASDPAWYDERNNTDALPRKICIWVDPKEHIKKLIGLYGYADYVEQENLWIPIGEVYMNTAAADDPTTQNLLPSFIIHNPNNYPIDLKVLTFI